MNSIVKEHQKIIEVLDLSGAQLSYLHKGDRLLVGIGNDFFVTQSDSSIEIYNDSCQLISSMNREKKAVVNAIENSIYIENGNFFDCFDKQLQLIKSYDLSEFFSL